MSDQNLYDLEYTSNEINDNENVSPNVSPSKESQNRNSEKSFKALLARENSDISYHNTESYYQKVVI